MDNVNLILSWAEKNTWLDTSLVESCKEFFYNHGYLTDYQEDYLKKLIIKYHIK